MNELIVAFINKIEDEAIRGGVFRAYNNLIAFFYAIVLTVVESVGIYFIKNGVPETFSDLTDKAMWELIIVSIIVQQIIVASAKKIERKTEEIKIEMSDEG